MTRRDITEERHPSGLTLKIARAASLKPIDMAAEEMGPTFRIKRGAAGGYSRSVERQIKIHEPGRRLIRVLGAPGESVT